MPKDSWGNMHLNSQRASAAGKMPMPKSKPMPGAPMKQESHEPEGERTTLHDHGDGTFHTESSDGEKMEHPHIGHALMHMGAKHAPDAIHMHHMKEHGAEHITSHHHMGRGGNPEGPHEHGSTEEAMDHMGQVMNGDEPHEDDGESPDSMKNGHEDIGLTGF